MKRKTLLLMFLLSTLFPAKALTRVLVVGNIDPAGVVNFREGMSILSLLSEAQSIGCTKIQVCRNENSAERVFQVNIATILLGMRSDVPIEDEDSISIPHHVLGCMDFEDSKRLPMLIRDYLEIMNRDQQFPDDWEVRVREIAGGHLRNLNN